MQDLVRHCSYLAVAISLSQLFSTPIYNYSVCQSDGTFECTKQEDCDAAGTEEEGDDVKHSTENKSP